MELLGALLVSNVDYINIHLIDLDLVLKAYTFIIHDYKKNVNKDINKLAQTYINLFIFSYKFDKERWYDLLRNKGIDSNKKLVIYQR